MKLLPTDDMNPEAESGVDFSVSADVPQRAWVLRWLDSGFRDHTEMKSCVFGLLGLSLMLVVVGGAFPYVALEWVRDRFHEDPSFVEAMLLIQTLFFVPLTVLGFVAVVPLFRGGSILLRLLVAFVVAAPGLAIFFAVSDAENTGPNFDEELCAALFVFFAAAGYVTVGVQLWSSWTLTPLLVSSDPLRRAGMRALFELTGVCAIVFAISMTLDVRGIVVGIGFMAVGGSLGAIAATGFLIGTLREQARVVFPTLMTFAIGFLIAVSLGVFFARIQFSWVWGLKNAAVVTLMALYGAALIVFMMWICTLWLRACGWSCQTSNTARKF